MKEVIKIEEEIAEKVADYKIKTYLVDEKVGCKHSKAFTKEWIEERKQLNIYVRNIEVIPFNPKTNKSMIQVTKKGNSFLVRIGNQINPAELQKLLIEELIKEGIMNKPL